MRIPSILRDLRIDRCKTTAGRCSLVLVLLPLLVCACDSRQREPEYRALSGTFDKINVQTGAVTFRFRSDKTGEYREERGLVPPETEILIDGKISELSEVEPGEEVSVVWRIEKRGARQLVTALKILVARGVSAPPTP